jgi:muramoyltetrapeptide carboxypeptidase LdcA involved in peptidoglycan recycling
MSADDKDQNTSENTGNEENTSSETPELSEEGKEKVRQMQEAYDDDRPTAVLPGTGGTITGTAINEWLDDEGNPKFGKDKQQEKQQEDAKGESQQHAEKA